MINSDKAAHAYPELLGLIAAGRLDPRRLVTRELGLDDAPAALAGVGATPGIAVVTTFEAVSPAG